MAFRVVVIDSHAKLEYSLNYLIYRTADTVKRILMDEIQTLVIQSTQVAITTSLLSELSKRKIKTIFCDEKRNPQSELVSYYGAHNPFRRISIQIAWSMEIKNLVWQAIVREKITQQAAFLHEQGKDDKAMQLIDFSKDVQPGDPTNREGHAAKVYFNSVFFDGFSRDMEHPVNAALNYGYTIFLSQFNRAIVSAGYLTAIGLHHIGETNPFNFSCDLIEPFRPFVDRVAKTLGPEDDFKSKMIALLAQECIIDEKRQTIANAINIYCLSVFSALSEEKVGLIKFPRYAGS